MASCIALRDVHIHIYSSTAKSHSSFWVVELFEMIKYKRNVSKSLSTL